MAKFSLTLPMFGQGGKVLIDGVDVAGVASWLRLEAPAGEVPRLVLQLPGDAVVEGEGIVEIHRPDDRHSIVEWLAGIDPEWLEEAVLRSSDMEEGTGTAFLRCLRQKALDEGQ